MDGSAPQGEVRGSPFRRRVLIVAGASAVALCLPLLVCAVGRRPAPPAGGRAIPAPAVAEVVPVVARAVAAEDAPGGTPARSSRPPLVLCGTIVGVSHRAAVINDTLYHEGAEIAIDGRRYLLSTVSPQQVVLTADDRVVTLSLAAADNGTEGDSSIVLEAGEDTR